MSSVPSPDPVPTLRFGSPGTRGGRPGRCHKVTAFAVGCGADRSCRRRRSPRGRSRTGSTSPCGCTSTRSWRQTDCSPTNRVARRPRPRSSRRSATAPGASGTARPKCPERRFDRIQEGHTSLQGDAGSSNPGVAVPKLWHTRFTKIDQYLRSQSARLKSSPCRSIPRWMRVRTAVTEGTANFLVNAPDEQVAADALVSARRRRWCLQVRCAVYNGTLGFGFSTGGSNPSAVPMQLSQSPPDPISFWTLPCRTA